MQDQSILSVVPFSFESYQIRTIDVDGEPWFVAADICAAISIASTGNAYSRLDDDEKGVRLVDTLGGSQNMTVVNESGLYSLILRSDKPEAKRFKKWVTSEVLPSIRKHGHYSVAPAAPVTDPMAILKLTFDALSQVSTRVESVEQTISTVEQSVTALTDTMRLHHWQCHELKAAVGKKAYQLNEEHGIGIKLLYPAVWGFVKRHFKVPVYTTIPAMRYDEALEIVKNVALEQLPDYVQNQAGGVQ